MDPALFDIVALNISVLSEVPNGTVCVVGPAALGSISSEVKCHRAAFPTTYGTGLLAVESIVSLLPSQLSQRIELLLGRLVVIFL